MCPICPLCGSKEASPFHEESGHHLVRCTSCTLIFVSPRPSEDFLKKHYESYLPTDPDEMRAWDRMMARVHRDVIRRLGRWIRSGKVLDVGCGFGFLLRDLLGAGYDAQGMDIAPRADPSLPVREGSLPDDSIPDGSFDAVIAIYVIEHLLDPMGFLKEVHRILHPGGVLILRWPHTTPIVRLLRPFGIEPTLYDLPSHLQDFSPSTMERALRAAGFRDVETRVGGWTRGAISLLTGALAEALSGVTGGRVLLPGVSKTTVATRG